jgi:hypothetical protein
MVRKFYEGGGDMGGSGMKHDIVKLKEIAKKAWTEKQEYSSNIPFNVIVRKPRASLSKYDSEEPTYWHYDDGVFVAVFQPSLVLELLDKIDALEAEIKKLAMGK